jgi:hypothetical protein
VISAVIMVGLAVIGLTVLRDVSASGGEGEGAAEEPTLADQGTKQPDSV